MDSPAIKLQEIFKAYFNEEDSTDLFRQLPSKDVSPAQWNKQIKFWSSIIHKWINDTDIAVVKVQELIDALTYEGLVPPLIPTIEFLIKTKVCKLESDYQPRSKINVITSMISSLVSRIHVHPQDTIIFVNNINQLCQKVGQKVIAKASCISDLILTEDELLQYVDEQLMPLVCNLLTKNKIAEKVENGFYFHRNGGQHPSNDTLKAIVMLKNVIKRYDALSEGMGQTVQRQRAMAVKLARRGRRQDAKNALIKIKEAEKNMARVEATRTNAMRMLLLHDTTDLSASTIEAIKSMNGAMATKKNEIGDADSVIDDFHAMADEINDAVDALGEVSIDDDEEIERELMALMREERTEPSNERPIRAQQSAAAYPKKRVLLAGAY